MNQPRAPGLPHRPSDILPGISRVATERLVKRLGVTNKKQILKLGFDDVARELGPVYAIQVFAALASK